MFHRCFETEVCTRCFAIEFLDRCFAFVLVNSVLAITFPTACNRVLELRGAPVSFFATVFAQSFFPGVSVEVV